MEEELNQIEKNYTWELVPRTADKNVIGTSGGSGTSWMKEKWQGKKQDYYFKVYSQVKGIDFEETFSPIAIMEAIKMFLALASHNNFKVYHMDVKSTFLNDDLEEEVYIEKPNGF